MFFGLNKFSRPNGWLLPIACHKYFESYVTWNYDLAYQQTNLVQTILNFPDIWDLLIRECVRSNSNFHPRDQDVDKSLGPKVISNCVTIAAELKQPDIAHLWSLHVWYFLGKFKLQYVTVSVRTLFCHFVATLLDRLLLQDFCWMWGRLWIKRWTMIMMT